MKLVASFQDLFGEANEVVEGESDSGDLLQDRETDTSEKSSDWKILQVGPKVEDVSLVVNVDSLLRLPPVISTFIGLVKAQGPSIEGLNSGLIADVQESWNLKVGSPCLRVTVNLTVILSSSINLLSSSQHDVSTLDISNR